MPTIAHLAVGLAAGRYMARNDKEAPRAMAFGAVLATLPDWDLVSHAFAGVQDTMAGHRGASHSLVAAVAVGALIGAVFGSRWWGRGKTAIWAILTIITHPILDLFNVQGKVGLFWPWTDQFSVVPVQFQLIPGVLSTADLLTRKVIPVLLWEAVIFLPFFVYAFWRPVKTRRGQQDREIQETATGR
jgi:inner membrane protein